MNDDFNQALWDQALFLEKECNKREHSVTRTVLQEALQVPQALAQKIQWLLTNKDIVQFKKDIKVVNKKGIVMCDIHVPFQDNQSLNTMFDYMDKFNPNFIIILGDLLDFYSISRFDKDPKRKEKVVDEIREGKRFLTELRKRYPKAQIIFKEGNHDRRLEKYIVDNSVEIYELIENLLQTSLGLHELKIQYQKKHFRINKLWYLHGHEKFGGGGSIEAMWKKIYTHFVYGHVHKSQEKIYKNIYSETFYTGSIGYLGGYMEYASINDWNQGFATVEYYKNGDHRVRQQKIFDGEIY